MCALCDSVDLWSEAEGGLRFVLKDHVLYIMSIESNYEPSNNCPSGRFSGVQVYDSNKYHPTMKDMPILEGEDPFYWAAWTQEFGKTIKETYLFAISLKRAAEILARILEVEINFEFHHNITRKDSKHTSISLDVDSNDIFNNPIEQQKRRILHEFKYNVSTATTVRGEYIAGCSCDIDKNMDVLPAKIWWDDMHSNDPKDAMAACSNLLVCIEAAKILNRDFKTDGEKPGINKLKVI